MPDRVREMLLTALCAGRYGLRQLLPSPRLWPPATASFGPISLASTVWPGWNFVFPSSFNLGKS